MKLHLSDDLSLPLDAVTRTFGLLAVRGAGKSNAAAVMAEEMFAAQLPFVVVDPVGSWWGLRSSGDGTQSGLPIPIFGGKHGDLPLERQAGELIADLVVDRRLSCVLDLSKFESEADKKKFLLDFARRLYNRNEQPLHLFLEEADDYIPQKPMRDEAQLLRAWENIVRRGRSRGLGITLITQRSAAINKMVLTQVETLFTLRTTGPQDIAAIEAWIKYHSVGREVLETLASLNDGDAWVWSPQFLHAMKRIHFRQRTTFDSGATPKNFTNKTTKAPATLADVDLAAIQTKMAETIERSKAEDPKELRRQLSSVRKELDDAQRLITIMEEKPMLTSVLTDPDRKLLTDCGQIFLLFTTDVSSVKDMCDQIRTLLDKVTQDRMHVSQTGTWPKPGSLPKPDFRKVSTARIERTSDSTLGRCERAILQVLSQFPEGCPADKLTLLSGYRFSGGFKNSLSNLRQAGLIEGGNTEVMSITPSGMKAGPFEPLPSNMVDYWLNHNSFGVCERRILEVLVQHRKGLKSEEICELTGYQYSGGFKNSLSNLRTAGVITGKNTEVMKASSDLF